ncbi:major facilitator superfamily domain-containing protein [Phascolomyces articulosus]|uniref:Major facilitator superfamily domain-containing protein n=1 Tax=Phascolomyces articulosus TaxID=60185 RepID=A0AAD5P9F3_9FUNG|nr:major facilitator superfamily domain-containing protein [Phascolomyces articulosus]
MEDLHLTEAEYRWCLTAPFLLFIVLCIPINLILRRWRPSLLVGCLALTWGGVTMATAGVTNFAGLLVCQIIPGVCSAANSAVQVYYVSLWYRRCESAQRLGWIGIAGSIGASVRGLIALAVTQIPVSNAVRSSWQWLFIIFGIPSVICGTVCLLLLPDSPQSAKFLTDEERRLAIERLRESTSAVYSWSWNQVLSVITDWKLYFYMLLFMTSAIAVSGGRLNLPDIIDGMGNWSAPVSLALTTPPNFIACFVIYLSSWLSDKFSQRAYLLIIMFSVIALGLLMIMFVPDQYIGVRYFAVCLFICGWLGFMPVRGAWCSDNFSGLTRRAVATAILYMSDSAGFVIGGHAYFDPPRYIMGHTIALCSIALSITTAILLRFMLSRVNRNRDQMNQLHCVEKKEQILIQYGGEKIIGDRHPDYRYSL